MILYRNFVGEVDETPFVQIVAIAAGSVIVGSVQVRLPKHRKVAGMACLFVREDRRRRGIARELVRRALLECEKAGMGSISWTVRKDNYEALALYCRTTQAVLAYEDAEDFWLAHQFQALDQVKILAALAKRQKEERAT